MSLDHSGTGIPACPELRRACDLLLRPSTVRKRNSAENLPSPDCSSTLTQNRFLQLTPTSHNAKIPHANRQPEGDSRSGRQTRRMERLSKRLVQDREEHGVAKFCGGPQQLEKF